MVITIILLVCQQTEEQCEKHVLQLDNQEFRVRISFFAKTSIFCCYNLL